MTDARYVRASKMLACALRHKPEEFGIELDAHGWAQMEPRSSHATLCHWACLSRDAQIDVPVLMYFVDMHQYLLSWLEIVCRVIDPFSPQVLL